MRLDRRSRPYSLHQNVFHPKSSNRFDSSRFRTQTRVSHVVMQHTSCSRIHSHVWRLFLHVPLPECCKQATAGDACTNVYVSGSRANNGSRRRCCFMLPDGPFECCTSCVRDLSQRRRASFGTDQQQHGVPLRRCRRRAEVPIWLRLFQVQSFTVVCGLHLIRQVPDTNNRRGFFQKVIWLALPTVVDTSSQSVVVVTSRPLSGLYSTLVAHLAHAYFSTGPPALSSGETSSFLVPVPNS